MRMRLLLLLTAGVVASVALVSASVSGAVPPPTTNVYAWIGLKNSDDVGTRFDLKAEVTNGSSEGYGTLLNFSGGSSGFNNAHLATIPITNYVGNASQSVSVTIWVRVACQSGHTSGTARLWWNDSAANSRVNESPGFGNLYLTGTNTLSTSVGPGPKKTSDVFVKKSGCPSQPEGNWKSFGTWTAVADVSLSAVPEGGLDRAVDVFATNAGPSTVTVSVDLTWQGTGCDAAAAVSGPVTLAPGETLKVWGIGWSDCDSSPIDAFAQVTSASVPDPDSTPNNYPNGFIGPAVEDDEVVVHFGPIGP